MAKKRKAAKIKVKKIRKAKKIIIRKLKIKKPAKRRKILVRKKIIRKKIKVKKILEKKKKVARPSLRAAAKQSQHLSFPRKRKSRLLRRSAPRNDEKYAKKHTKKVKKQIEKSPANEFPAESLFKARIKVIGIGGGGGSIVSEIGRSLEKASFVVADTDIRALKKKSGIKYFWFGEEQTHGLGTGVNVDLAKQAAESAKEKISGIFKDQDIIIFIASLGGGLGSGATQVFAQAAREFGGITFGIFTMPFKFEGKNKYRIAQNALRSLRQSLNVSLVIPNEKIFKIIDADTPITDAFSIVNKSLIESLESLIDLIYNPGIINIDFADLRTILKGRGNTAFLNTIEESGKSRAEKICERVLANPLLQNNNFEAEKILFNIAGSENLSMFEVEKVSSHIANLNPKAKIIFGISKNSKLKNKIKTTILMTGGQIKDELPAKKLEPEKIAEIKIVSAEKRPASAKASAGKEKTKPPKVKKPPSQKPPQKSKQKKEKPKPKVEIKKEQNPVSIIPVFEVPVPSMPVVEQSRINVKTIRRSGLEIKKAEEQEEKKRIAQEKEWEIPAFLRRVKYKS